MLLARIAAAPGLTGLALRAELACRGTKVSYDAVWRFLRNERLTFKRKPARLFLFIGVVPNAGWLQGCVETDAKGFVVTGAGALPLETSLPGVFAIGDVRAGSTSDNRGYDPPEGWG